MGVSLGTINMGEERRFGEGRGRKEGRNTVSWKLVFVKLVGG